MFVDGEDVALRCADFEEERQIHITEIDAILYSESNDAILCTPNIAAS